MVEVGTWKDFDDIESHLILDELLMLTDQLNKKHRQQMRISLLAQGVDIDEDEEHKSDDDLPEEVLAAERKFKEERERKRAEKAAKDGMQTFAQGLGYEVVS